MMMKKGREMFTRRKDDKTSVCDVTNCSAQEYVRKVSDDFTRIAERLTEGQITMQINLAKLTESVAGIKRLDNDLSKLENKVDKNSEMLWKVVGAAMAVAVIIPLVIEKFI